MSVKLPMGGWSRFEALSGGQQVTPRWDPTPAHPVGAHPPSSPSRVASRESPDGTPPALTIRWDPPFLVQALVAVSLAMALHEADKAPLLLFDEAVRTTDSTEAKHARAFDVGCAWG
jgi:hypothetical protein